MKPNELAKRLERAGTEVKGATERGAKAAGKIVQKSALASLASATGGSLALRGVGKDKKMAVVTKQIAPDAVLVKGVPGGMWSWLEKGTKPHIVGSGKGKTGIAQSLKNHRTFTTNAKGNRSYKRKLLVVNGQVVTGPFVAGGSPAKHTFTHGVEAGLPLVPQAVAKETRAALTKALK